MNGGTQCGAVKLESEGQSTPYASLFTPWSNFLATQTTAGFPFPSPNPSLQLQSNQPNASSTATSTTTAGGDPYVPWTPDGIVFGGTGFTPGWQISGIFHHDASSHPGANGWTTGLTPESERGPAVGLVRRTSNVVKQEEYDQHGPDGFAREVEKHNQRVNSMPELKPHRMASSASDPMRSNFQGNTLDVGGPSSATELTSTIEAEHAVRPSAVPLQVDTSETSHASNDSSGFSNEDLTTASNGAPRATHSTSSLDSSASHSVETSAADLQWRRTSHAPRHIVDLAGTDRDRSLSAMSQSQFQQQLSSHMRRYRPDEMDSRDPPSYQQDMSTFNGFSSSFQQQHALPLHNPYMNSVDPMTQAPTRENSQYPHQQYHASRDQYPSFLQMPYRATSDMRQSNSNQGGNTGPPQGYPFQHRDSRDSTTSSTAPSISPAMLSRPPSHGSGQHIGPAVQTNEIFGSPISAHSALSETEQHQPTSRNDSEVGGAYGGPGGGRSPHRGQVTAHAARHPYMDEYHRRSMTDFGGNAVASSSSPGTSPRLGPKKPSSGKAAKRSPLEPPSSLGNPSSTAPGGGGSGPGRVTSMDFSDEENDIPEGIEKDGMMWGMKTEEYRALSARERKRVRNRISARTFRARRKEHLNDLESGMAERNAVLKDAQDTIRLLRQENSELARRLSKYESV